MGPPALPGEIEAEDDKKPKHRRRRNRRRWLLPVVAVAALVLIAGGVLAWAATESVPAATTVIELDSTAHTPGAQAGLAWPATGEAALSTASGSAIGSSGSAQPQPIASITKVMTAYLVLKDHPLTPGSPGFTMTVTAAEAARLPARIADNESLVYLHAGQVLTEREALQALMLASADNVADDLAVFDSGSLPAFVAGMNRQAAALGMTHTHYADASGLDKATVSTATDLLRLARVAMAVPAFASIVAQPSVKTTGLGTLHNYNTLAGTDGYTGIKTGSTLAAGQALLFSVSRNVDGRPVSVLGVVLEQHGPGVVGGAITATTTLVDSLYSQLRMQTVLPAGTPVAAVSRVGRSAVLRTRQPLRVLALPDASVHVDVAVHRDPRTRSATVTVTSPFGVDRSGTSTWVVPTVGLGWRLSHLF